ncbi:hypothetical protein FE257_011781 [Aspergillus nanangensis]|uniref:DUF1688 domain protein n=1 Tax=Aspergillus nanangensis TaxID=2582783 RepID=A0AAD4CV87_ASPNN|nr:hypothetical protein FE257_011781 [Aspergillus nanangensis]
MTPEINYILSLQAVRDRAHHVLFLAESNRLNHFDYNPDRLTDVVQYVTNVIKDGYGPDKYAQIPPHGRWQHFLVGDVDRIATLLHRYKHRGYNLKEEARSLVDLFFVSVLLDAGAGDAWKFREPDTEATFVRSEGIAVASLHMFLNGEFATVSSTRKDVVLGAALRDLKASQLELGFQIEESNPFIGTAARVELLNALGKSLLDLPEIFGDDGRPGNLVDYLLAKAGQTGPIDFEDLWQLLQKVLLPIWPSSRTQLDGHPVGDAWPLHALAQNPDPSAPPQHQKYANIQPFHKLTQWLAYSLMVPFERLLRRPFENAHLATGLPEYRNGGVFVDLGVLTLKPRSLEQGRKNSGGDLPAFEATGDEIVEWRALTVALLDKVHGALQETELAAAQLTLPQVLEAGSWKAGRKLAAENRPDTKSSPILIMGDGTLF